jgi:hypothetical protein
MRSRVAYEDIIRLQNSFSLQGQSCKIVQLQEMQESVQQYIEQLHDEFQEQKAKMLAVLQEVLTKHLKAHSKYAKNMPAYTNYFTQLVELYAGLEDADDFYTFDARLGAFILHCQKKEVKLVVCDYRLSHALAAEQQKFKQAGQLPRNFQRDLRDNILTLLQEAKNEVRQSSAVVRWNGQFFETLQNGLDVASGEHAVQIFNEMELDEFLQILENILHGHIPTATGTMGNKVLHELAKNLSGLGIAAELSFVGPFRMATRKATERALQKFRRQLTENGWLQTALANDNLQKLKMLNKLQQEIAGQIAVRSGSLKERVQLLLRAHNKAVEHFLKPKKLCESVQTYLLNRLREIENIIFDKIVLREDNVQRIFASYQDFWLNLISDLDATAKQAQQHDELYRSKTQADYLRLRDSVYKAVSYLKTEEKVLVTKFSDFDVPCIIKELNDTLARAYRFSFFTRGEERTEQLLRLEIRLKIHGRDPTAVGLILEQELSNILSSHNSQSHAYNFSLWRRQSRSANALANFMNHCVRHGWAILPEKSKVMLFEQTFTRQMQRYFDQSFFSSLVQRGIVAKIAEAIYHAKVQLCEQKDYTQWQALNEIANALASVIQQAENRHAQKLSTRVRRFFGFSAQSDFVENLRAVQAYAHRQKYLPRAFASDSAAAVVRGLVQLRETFFELQQDNGLLTHQSKLAAEKQQAMVDLSVVIRHIEDRCIDYAGASLAAAQLLDKFENGDYYLNQCFHQYLLRLVQGLEAQGHLLPREQVLGDHLNKVQENLDDVHAQLQTLRARAS